MALTASDLKRAACQAIDKFAEKLHELSNDIWSHPELLFEERYAHEALTNFLEEKAGFPNVERHYVLETGFRAVYGDKESPHVCVICEYDALPDIGHACGHNLIAEVGVAAGIGIKAAIDAAQKAGQSLGKLTVLGTPAEEGGCGKVDFINHGTFRDIDLAMMSHPWPGSIEPDAKRFLCRERVTVKYLGRASHAAGFPWEGINALDAAVMAYTNISVLRQQMKPTWRVHGVILKGGTKPNIIPELTELDYYIRAPTKSEVALLKSKVVGCFEAAAKATSCQVEYDWWRPSLNVVTSPTLAARYTENAREMGVQLDTGSGQQAQSGGSTDMGNVSQEVPSIHPMYYIGSSAVNHTREFTAAAGDKIAQPYTLDQGKLLAMTAIDVMCQPDLVPTMKDQLKQQLANE